MVSEAGAILLSVLQHHFQQKDKQFCTPYVITVDCYFSEARKQLDQVMIPGYENCDG